MADRPPHEIARETLQQLAARKLPPTPENYQKVFHEVAGTARRVPFPLEELQLLVQGLPAKTPGQVRQLGLLQSAVTRLSWEGVRTALFTYGTYIPTSEAAANGGISGFGGLNPTPATLATPSAPAPMAPVKLGNDGAPALTADFLEQIARMIEYARPALGEDDARFTQQTQELLKSIRQPGADVTQVKASLSNFGHRLSFAAEDQAEIKSTLLHLLHLIIQNIGELSVDDRWLKGQIDALLEASTPPLTLRRLDDVERRLKDVIFKQTEAKGRALEAHEEMRQMLATFIQRLSQMAESSASFQSKMEDSTRLIEQAKSIVDLTPVMKDVIGATRTMAADSREVRDELRGMKERAQTTDDQIAKLHEELDRVSVQARHDSLTGVLNRKGLDEALNREVANVRRKDTPLCVAMLDIDNFKKLNDTMGHVVGDAALKHLAEVARECMRPQDTLARYGGEEFIILLPDTVLEKSVDAMTRLQRELTKRLFLTGTEKVLITFSAGVAQLEPQEEGADAIRRADQGMYLAKRAGKNRVLAA